MLREVALISFDTLVEKKIYSCLVENHKYQLIKKHVSDLVQKDTQKKEHCQCNTVDKLGYCNKVVAIFLAAKFP